MPSPLDTCQPPSKMIYGRAVVRTLERWFSPGEGIPAETRGLAWIDREVFSIVPDRGGWVVDFCKGGGSGWYPVGNIGVVNMSPAP